MDKNVQIIRDAKGEPEFAVVPWREFEKLRDAASEDVFLIAAGNSARKDEAFPADVAKRLVAGASPLKVIREWRKQTQPDLTQEKLSSDSGVAKLYISQIERGARGVGKKAAEKLAAALDVSVETLMM